MSIEVPGPHPREVGIMSLLGNLIYACQYESHMIPVLHQHHVHLVDHDHLHGGEIVVLMLLLDKKTQAQRTRNNHVTLIKWTVQLQSLAREFDAQLKIVVNVALERVPVVVGVSVCKLGVSKLVKRARW